jgi:hypothetical protein
MALQEHEFIKAKAVGHSIDISVRGGDVYNKENSAHVFCDLQEAISFRDQLIEAIKEVAAFESKKLAASNHNEL